VDEDASTEEADNKTMGEFTVKEKGSDLQARRKLALHRSLAFEVAMG
jgi:hypothetical protein